MPDPEADKLASAYDKGARDAIRDSTIAQHTEHLRLINGSMDRTSVELGRIRQQVSAIETARAEETAVNRALARYLEQAEGVTALRSAKGVTAKQLWISVLAIIVPVIVSVVIAVIISSANTTSVSPVTTTTRTTP